MDVLSACCPDQLASGDAGKLHVVFEGLDLYAASTPLPLIRDIDGDAILAIDMNGEPLPPGNQLRRVLLRVFCEANIVCWQITAPLFAC